jgi:GAF domain-containing protein
LTTFEHSVDAQLTPVLHQLATAPDVDHVCGVLRSVARGLVKADGVTFVLREGDVCHYAEEDAIAPLWKGQRFPMSACLSGWVMLKSLPAVVPDIYVDDRILHEAYRPTFVKSVAMVPVGTPPFAAIGAYWAREHTATQSELEMLQAMADSAAIALRR